MGMASFTDNEEQLKNEFGNLYKSFNSLKENKSLNGNLKTLSMGMSGDYELAIKCGSNMIRVGSSIFGVRNYKI
jgi:hypothetical protein